MLDSFTVPSSSISNSFNFKTDVEDWDSFKHFIHHSNNFPSNYVNCIEDAEFNKVLKSAYEAIEAHVYPVLIPDGSSGSYYIKDKNNKFIAVFKPKDEEPFASLNPKWPKYFQKILCFCCFGRACLIPNHGYLSETGASLVDSRLEFHIVPKTRVVKLFSPTFYYRKSSDHIVNPKPKKGSFQLYVENYRSAKDVIAEWNDKGVVNVLSPLEIKQFTILFQKMCILDYIIRNTDRHLNNWLILHIPKIELKIAAIDNGLSFPIKHPERASRFRHYPFDWTTLSWAYESWDSSLRETLLKKLTPNFVDILCRELKALFFIDKTSNRLLTQAQIRVVRGQLWNLRLSLLARETPCDLIKRTQVLVTRRYHNKSISAEWEKCFRIKSDENSKRVFC